MPDVDFEKWQAEQKEIRNELTGKLVAVVIQSEVSYNIALQALERAACYIQYFPKVTNYTALEIARMLEENYSYLVKK